MKILLSNEEVWSYGEDRGKDFFSNISGNTQYLPDTQNRLITSGAIREDHSNLTESRIVEVTDDDDPEKMFEVKTPKFDSNDHRYIYRSFRWPLYPDHTWEFDFGEPGS